MVTGSKSTTSTCVNGLTFSYRGGAWGRGGGLAFTPPLLLSFSFLSTEDDSATTAGSAAAAAEGTTAVFLTAAVSALLLEWLVKDG